MAKYKGDNISETFIETSSGIINGVIGIAILLLVTVFPLVYHDSYVDILETKYLCYWICAIGMLGISLLIGLLLMAIDFKEFQGDHTKRLKSRLIPKSWNNSSLIPDAAVALFWLIAVISTMQSEYVYESFWGNEGRYSGLFLLTLYVATYFLISRFWKPKRWYLQLFLITGMIMCIIGITDYFQMDILEFRGRIVPDNAKVFTSTIGNINTYTAYVGMVLGFSAAMFSVEKKLWKILWYYLCMVISITAIIMGCSDNAYLSIAALFGLLPFVLFSSRRGILRYLILLATFFSVIQMIDWINQKYEEIVIGVNSLFQVIVEFKYLSKLVTALWEVVVLFWILCKLWDFIQKKELLNKVCMLLFNHLKDYPMAENNLSADTNHNMENNAGSPEDSADDRREEPLKKRIRFPKKTLVYLWGAGLIFAIIVVSYMFYDVNVKGNVERYGPLQSYLVFNDRWGTTRGYIWIKSVEMYKKLPLLHKLFGYGPDTFAVLTRNKIWNEMIAATGVFFDSAHNSLLQYLLTIGPIGTAGYTIFLISSVWYMMKKCEGNGYLLGVACGVACYALQSTVNIDLPIATPTMWLLASIGMAWCRWKDEEEEKIALESK